MTRNYIECGQFVYISPKVSGLYALDSISGRIESLRSMVTFIPPDLPNSAKNSLYPFGIVLAIGWVSAMIAGVLRTGTLKRFPLPLSAFAWGGFLVFFFMFNIHAGYGIRWGTPLIPIWILSFFFVIDMAYAMVSGKGDRRSKL